MGTATELEDRQLIGELDAWNQRVCSSQHRLFGVISKIDERRAWRDSGARDMAHWLRMRLGISEWKARRWIAASHALENLPRISEDFSSGQIGIDKVVELTGSPPPTPSLIFSGGQRASPAGPFGTRAI